MHSGWYERSMAAERIVLSSTGAAAGFTETARVVACLICQAEYQWFLLVVILCEQDVISCSAAASLTCREISMAHGRHGDVQRQRYLLTKPVDVLSNACRSLPCLFSG